jgi:hypothetical protein
MSASGRVCEITNGRFVEAKHEKRWLAVRLLRSKPAGRFGSRRHVPKKAEHEGQVRVAGMTSQLLRSAPFNHTGMWVPGHCELL